MCRLNLRPSASLWVVLVVVGPLAGLARAEVGGAEIYRRTLRSTAWVYTPSIGASGTGWVVDRARRLIVTNQHVVDNADSVEVLFPAYRGGRVIGERSYYKDNLKTIRGRVVDAVVDRDLALIELESLPADIQELPLAAGSPNPGDQVYSIGNPGASGALWVFTSGNVRAVYHKRWATTGGKGIAWRKARVVETSSPTNPGDSGGPVVNARAELVAVTESGNTKAQLVTTFIDVGDVQSFLADARRLMEPRSAEDHYLRGVHLEQVGLFDRSIEAYTRTLKLDPRHGWAYVGRGNGFLARHDYDTAIADYSKAIAGDPGRELTYYNRGLAWHGKRNYDKAIADFTRAIQLKPVYGEAYLARGNSYLDKGAYGRAVTDYTQAIKISDGAGLEWAYNGRGLALGRKGNVLEAIADFTAGLKINPHADLIWDNRAWALIENKEYQEALENAKQALSLNPKNGLAWARVAAVFFHQKEYARAIPPYTEAIRLRPADPDAYFWRGWCHRMLSNDARARSDFAQAVRLDSSYASKVPAQ